MTDHAAFPVDVVEGAQAKVKGAAAIAAPVVATICVSLLIACALAFGRAKIVWMTGAFFDSDDAMRAVQLRGYLGGQGWFDLAAHRIDPPNGASMHWSRIVDVPLVGIERFFSLFFAGEFVERATRLAFPLLLLAALFALVSRLTLVLAGPAARPAAIWLTLLSGAVFMQFAPGRIDHHAPQIVTLVAALSFFLQGLDPARASRLAVAAMLMAFSVAISLENMPFFVVMIAALPLIYIVEGNGAPLIWFSAGALVAFPALYKLTVAPGSAFASYCDGYSFVHLAAIVVGAGSFAVLGAAANRLATSRARFIGVIIAGVATAATVALIAPRCVGDPLNILDPWLRELWLSHVAEARPLLSFWEKSPTIVISIGAPALFGLLASIALAWRTDPLARRRWLLMTATIFVGLLAGLWQVRVFSSVTPIALVPLAVAIVQLVEKMPARPGIRIAFAAMLAAVLSPMGLALAMPAGNDATPDNLCLAPKNFDALAMMKPARVAAPFDLGSYILAHTPHSAFAAPYHRNNHGNLIVARAFTAPPNEAEKILREAGAELVVWCGRQTPTPALAAAASTGLGALLARGEPPGWLERKSAEGDALLVFALRPAEN